MELWNPSTEPWSFTRMVTRAWRQAYHVHTLQWYRWVLGLAAGIHIVPNVGKLYWHFTTHHYPAVFPDFLAFTLSVAARFIWVFVFRNPAEFLGIRRPARVYTWAVAAIVVLTTLPNGVVHVWALRMAFKNNTTIYSGIVEAVLAMMFWVPTAGLALWMAWRFLLGADESDEEFEPVCKKSMVICRGQGDDSVPIIEPYRDDLSPQPASETAHGYLAEAYERQGVANPGPLPDSRNPADSTNLIGASPQEGVREDVNDQEQTQEPVGAQDATSSTDAAHPSRCPTIARFEYMSQRSSGPHSWLTYPIIPFLLATYGTILLIILPIFIHEDRAFDLRAPSPTLKKSLYMPLGLYLLSFYAVKHRIRASLFERIIIPPPEPWKKMFSILPSWIGTGATFRNKETGEITVYDPRRRALPWQGYRNPLLIDTKDYIRAFNSNPGQCTSYWGHAGPTEASNLRFRPTIHRIGFLALAVYFTFTGFWNTIFYDVPNEFKLRLEHWKTITPGDIARIRRLVAFWQGLLYPGMYFTVMGGTFAGLAIVSLLALFFKTGWKFVPKKEKDNVQRLAREAHEEQERQRRARLG